MYVGMRHPLGEAKELRLPQGTVRYRDVGSGSGPPIVFVHGLLVNSLLWRKVVPSLAGERRCIVPDLPLGCMTCRLTQVRTCRRAGSRG